MKGNNTMFKKRTDKTIVNNLKIFMSERLSLLMLLIMAFTGIFGFNSTATANVVVGDLGLKQGQWVAISDTVGTIPASDNYLDRMESVLKISPITNFSATSLGSQVLVEAGLTSTECLNRLKLLAGPYNDIKLVTLSVGSSDLFEPEITAIDDIISKANANNGTTLTRAQVFEYLSAGLASITSLPTPQRNALTEIYGNLQSELTDPSFINQMKSASDILVKNMGDIISLLKTQFPNAKILVANLYNPFYSDVFPGLGSDQIDIGSFTNDIIDACNNNIKLGNFTSNNPIEADISKAFKDVTNSDTKLFDDDLIHLSDAGAQLYADTMLTLIAGWNFSTDNIAAPLTRDNTTKIGAIFASVSILSAIYILLNIINRRKKTAHN